MQYSARQGCQRAPGSTGALSKPLLVNQEVHTHAHTHTYIYMYIDVYENDYGVTVWSTDLKFVLQ